MSGARFVNIDRETPLLMPPDLREWVRDDDLAHFLLAALEGVDCRYARVNQKGCGSEQYPPGMMLATLIYCYAHGIFSSRKIEAATYHHVSVRLMTANEHPDHDTICKFRRENDALIRQAFDHVLSVGALCGLGQLGTVFLDGTKILANANKRRSLTTEQLRELEKRVQGQIDALLVEAEKADQEDQPDPTRLPQELASKQKLRDKLVEAREKLAEVTRMKAQEREQEREAVRAEKFGRLPEPLSATPGANETINLTDSESKLMPTPKDGYRQAYNGQAVISAEPEGGLILETKVCQQTNDRLQLEPMVRRLVDKSGKDKILTVGVDTGYDNVVQIRRVEEEYGIKIICSPQQRKEESAAHDKPQHRQSRAIKAAAEYRQKIAQRAATAEGKAILKLRSTTIEPAFGIMKSAMGWNRALLRGLEKVDLEFRLVALAFNCRRLIQRFGKDLLKKLQES